MDENYNIVPHGVNFQDPIFPDTVDNHRMFASLFQFSNCTPGTQVHSFTPEWEAQEDSRVRNHSEPPSYTSFVIVTLLESSVSHTVREHDFYLDSVVTDSWWLHTCFGGKSEISPSSLKYSAHKIDSKLHPVVFKGIP